MKEAERVVLDTTTVVGALLRGEGKPARVLDEILSNYELVASKETMSELADVFSRAKFAKIDDARKRDILDAVYENAALVDVTHEVKACPDPKDDKFLSLAVSAGAQHIVSSDKHLLNMKNFHGVEIWSPAQFLERERALTERAQRPTEQPRSVADRMLDVARAELADERAIETAEQRLERERRDMDRDARDRRP